MEREIERMAPRENVADLRVHETVKGRAADDHSSADAGADREIREVIDALGNTPPAFGECGGVDVGIETDGASVLPRKAPRNIGTLPSGLRSLADETMTRRAGIEFDRAETRDADGGKRTEGAPVTQEGVHARERRRRVGGGKALLSEDFAAIVADGAHELGAAGFDRTEKTTLRHDRSIAHSACAFRFERSGQAGRW